MSVPGLSYIYCIYIFTFFNIFIFCYVVLIFLIKNIEQKKCAVFGELERINGNYNLFQ